jgi:hypothetical protein
VLKAKSDQEASLEREAPEEHAEILDAKERLVLEVTEVTEDTPERMGAVVLLDAKDPWDPRVVKERKEKEERV